MSKGKKPSLRAKAKSAAAEPKTRAPESRRPRVDRLCPVAGFGASAGGLEAFTELLQCLPEDTGMAFVLVQHLDPKHQSLLTELLAKSTPMPVLQVKDGMRAEANKVYVIPPNANMTIANNVLHLEARPVSHMPIDRFFRSLAQDQGSRAIGVILSGTASDGTLGLKAIKAEGGITFAQDEKTAKYDGMPRSAMLAGCVDFILPPERIAHELVRLCQHPYVAPPPSADEVQRENEQQFSPIFAMLRNATGVDFGYYKRATVGRRILRRMALHKTETVNQYAEYLRQSAGELQALFQDILINVTGFFREPATFEALGKEVFPPILKDRAPEEPVRVWVPGCATGEDAYSVAISLLEYMRENDLELPIQIFGTDLNESSLEKARAGVYPETISADVSAERLRRFFIRVNGNYQISRAIRDMCIFARQDLTRDPPFSKLDLILCRNVLIYLGPALQAKALRYFHYGLKPNGFLVLGLSETIGSAAELFAPIEGKEKIYSRKMAAAAMALDLASIEDTRGDVSFKRPDEWTVGTGLQRKVDQLILARHSPAGVVVDEDLKVLQFRGHTAPYLEHSAGQPSLSLLKMIRESAGLEVRKLIQKVKKAGASVISEPIRLAVNDAVRPARLAISLIRGQQRELAFLILFEDSSERTSRALPGRGKREGGKAGAANRVHELEEELSATKQYLQSVIEEQEAASEELKSAHEEVQSSNEELQSTNEELLTSKEELQSINEELTTVNEEMQGRNTELTQSNSDLNNLLSSVNIPIVMLGNDLRIRRFTPQAEKVLNLLPTDAGRKLTDFRIKIFIPDIEALFMDVIDSLQTKEREVQDQEGRTYLMSIRPYRTVDNKIDGAVMTLYDITDRKQAADVRYRRLFESAKDGILILEAKTGEILDASPFLSKLFGYPRHELVGRPFRETSLFQDTDLAAESLENLHDGESVEKTITLRNRSGENVPSEVIGNAYLEGQRQVIQLSIRDVSARKKAEESLRRDQEQLRQGEKMEAVGRLAGGVAHDFNNLLTAIVGYSDLLKGQLGADETQQHHLEEIRKAGERATSLTRQLLAFGRKQVLEPKFLDLNAVLTEMEQMLHVMITDRIELVRVAQFDIGPIKADRGQIEQVVTNLILNARDAMPEGGKITIETANAQVDPEFSQSHPAVPPGDYVMLSVSDTGTGMDMETRAHLFEPFFTTKPKGLGTGLGLATIYGIVKQSGGHIWAYSELGQGTTFKIYLPRVHGKAAAVEPKPASLAQARGTETVLLVEDEPMVRRLALTILREGGYHVLEAANGPEALRIAREHGDSIHLLLTDVVMPRMSGREVADRLKAQRPDLKILFMSGNTEEAIGNHGVLEPGFAFLQKPFTPARLSSKLREVLDTSAKPRTATVKKR